jgi:hypothetical protein
MMKFYIFHDCSPLVLILCLPSQISTAQCLQTFCHLTAGLTIRRVPVVYIELISCKGSAPASQPSQPIYFDNFHCNWFII